LGIESKATQHCASAVSESDYVPEGGDQRVSSGWLLFAKFLNFFGCHASTFYCVLRTL
jgi:hypothetical protein